MGKKHAGFPELCRLHAKKYDCTIEQSKDIINSVLESFKDMLRQTDVLVLKDFGKFETKYRAPYTLRSNLPDRLGEVKEVSAAYKVKFCASPKFNDAAGEFFTKNNSKKPSE